MYTEVTEAQRSRYKERKRREDAAIATANAMLAEMVKTFDGGGWAIAQDDHERYLVRDDRRASNDNRRVRIQPDLQKRRLKFIGVTPALPKDAPYQLRSNAPSVSVSIDRNPETIARDVARRLLPEHNTALAEQAQKVTQWQNGQQSLDTFAESIAGVLGTTVHRPNRQKPGDSRKMSVHKYHGRANAQVEVWQGSRGDAARFEVTVYGEENVQRVAALLRELNQGEVI